MGLRKQSAVGCILQFFAVILGASACGVTNAINNQFYFSNRGLCKATYSTGLGVLRCAAD